MTAAAGLNVESDLDPFEERGSWLWDSNLPSAKFRECEEPVSIEDLLGQDVAIEVAGRPSGDRRA